ncbi:hypothetical protein F5146DRAFT_987259 [Armillaria mellea]|nr:hypothetical protein F5146DRAFT_987259 [Armillaria mellea]
MNVDAQRAPITTADVPFNDPADSVDLVIRTADNVDFFVLSALLSLRSPSSFFRQVFPGNVDTEERDGFPVLEVEEDSVTFRTILLLCYPYVAPEIQSIQEFRAVGVALERYRMDRAMERFVQAVLVSAMISEQPLRVFAVAVANGWKKLGEAAARNTLATPLNRAISDVEELNEISAHHLYRLQDYHARCGKAAQIQAGAEAPFNDTSDLADLVIRTTDNVDFFVHRVLLSLKSPSSFFRRRKLLHRGEPHVLEGSRHTEERDGLPVLEVKEDSSTFRKVLLFCYPYDVPEMKNIEECFAVGVVLDKYCLDNGFERFVRVMVVSPLMKHNALRIFGFAAAHGWKELEEAAARNTFRVALDQKVELDSLDSIPALQYSRLRDYRERCGKAAQFESNPTLGEKMTWIAGKTSELLFMRSDLEEPICRWCRKPLTCWMTTGDQIFRTHGWLADYVNTVKARVLRQPTSEIALDKDIVAQAVVKSISQCGHEGWTKIAASQIYQYATLLANEIERLIVQVSDVTAAEWSRLNDLPRYR